MTSSFSQANQWQYKNVLVLHSYSPSYQWTADFQSGIEQAIAKSNTKLKLSLEYLDTKRVYNETYYSEFIRYFNTKYQHYQFDAVLVTDDNALDLINQWPDNPFKGLPIIAAGINNQSATLSAVTSRYRIIYERDEIDKTVELMSRVRPNLQRLYYISDRSTTSQYVREKALEVLARNSSIEVIEIRDIPLARVGEELQGISPDDAVILTHYNTDIDRGIYHRYQYVAQEIAINSPAPVFVFWEFYITNGIFGGYVNRSEQVGREMLLALDEFIPLNFSEEVNVGHSSRPVVDFEALERFGIDEHQLPQNTLILNQPESFIKSNWQLLSIAASIIFCMALVIVTQAVTIRQKRELNKKNKKIVQLQKKTLKTQKDMIVVLGEAIETRSGETGNHVKRVAQLSSLLARLHGLSHREVELIEIISPMHDVGKIAIPESILEKLGQLDSSEWEIMQTHTSHGYKLLNASSGEVFNLAATVAHEHHERWDGSGYPNGLAGENIHIFSRITAIADVFDALLSVRCYKRAWTLEEVVEHFKREHGAQFDPELTTILLDNLDDFIAIRNAYPDKG
ncbi:hypothetical protein VII00023_20187 [Vibrio ichthyoenteri ATCC 700023]|uniref:HD-GYP domain-containing protein n=1 Tax=Vibrio ichthyoenteri ATCC 700023 TaxID=870968 RepID=F9RZN9_9VIBR|nr:HD domain-containing phosphohydrolase [Vibrio ichthyoenteri]EGU44698.1 hypothetical protein VII00023_20187 [Vibrio ichthyoenteri ATCC 700023]